MAYPRRCPLCGADYPAARTELTGHATLRSAPGGTPSAWRPELPGRLLTLRCLACDGEYAWDYFAGAAPGRAGAPPPRRPRGRRMAVGWRTMLPGSRQRR